MPQAPPQGPLVVKPQEARQSTPLAWEVTPDPVLPPPVRATTLSAHDLRLQQAELTGIRLGQEEVDQLFARAELEGLAVPQQLGEEWVDTITRAKFEALDAEIAALFKKGDVVAAEQARQRQFRRGQEITQAQAGVPGPATNVVVELAALPAKLRFGQSYSDTAKVPQPLVAEPTHLSKAQVAEDIEHAYTQATATGQAGYKTQSTPADVERQRAPSPKDRAEGRGAPAHQPDATHAVASLTRLVQECLDAFKGGLHAVVCELNEWEDRGVTDVEDAASRGLNAACGGVVAKLRAAAGDITDITVARTAMAVLNHSFQGGGALVPDERDTRVAAMEQAFDELEVMHHELVAANKALEAEIVSLWECRPSGINPRGLGEPKKQTNLGEEPEISTGTKGLTAESSLVEVIDYVQHLLVGDANQEVAVQNLHAQVAQLENRRAAPEVVPYEEECDPLFRWGAEGATNDEFWGGPMDKDGLYGLESQLVLGDHTPAAMLVDGEQAPAQGTAAAKPKAVVTDSLTAQQRKNQKCAARRAAKKGKEAQPGQLPGPPALKMHTHPVAKAAAAEAAAAAAGGGGKAPPAQDPAPAQAEPRAMLFAGAVKADPGHSFQGGLGFVTVGKGGKAVKPAKPATPAPTSPAKKPTPSTTAKKGMDRTSVVIAIPHRETPRFGAQQFLQAALYATVSQAFNQPAWAADKPVCVEYTQRGKIWVVIHPKTDRARIPGVVGLVIQALKLEGATWMLEQAVLCVAVRGIPCQDPLQTDKDSNPVRISEAGIAASLVDSNPWLFGKANGVQFAKPLFVTTKVDLKNPWRPVTVSMVLSRLYPRHTTKHKQTKRTVGGGDDGDRRGGGPESLGRSNTSIDE
jgi:hypothetical protein